MLAQNLVTPDQTIDHRGKRPAADHVDEGLGAEADLGISLDVAEILQRSRNAPSAVGRSSGKNLGLRCIAGLKLTLMAKP